MSKDWPKIKANLDEAEKIVHQIHGIGPHRWWSKAHVRFYLEFWKLEWKRIWRKV